MEMTPIYSIEEKVAREIALIGAAVWLPGYLHEPSVKAKMVVAGQPFIIGNQITEEEFKNKVIASGVSSDWLTPVPPGASFWEVSTD